MLSAEQLHRRGVVAMNAGRLAAAARYLERARSAAVDPALRARVEASVAFLGSDSADLEQALRRCRSALAFPDLPTEIRGVLQSQEAAILRRSGQPRAALEAFGAAIESLGGLPWDLGTAHINRGMMRLDAGELAEADADFAAAAEAYGRAGDSLGQAKANHNRGYTRMLRGDLVGSLATYDAAAHVLVDGGPVVRAVLAQDRAEALLAAGRAAEGLELLRSAATDYGRRRLRRRQAEVELLLAGHLLDESPREARRAAACAMRRFARLGLEAWRERAEAEVLAADIALGSTSPRLVETADRLAGSFRALGLGWRSTAVELQAIRVLVRRGDLASARRRAATVRHRRNVPLAARLEEHDVRAELTAAEGRRTQALRHLARGLEDLHTWQSSFGSLDLQTNVAGHGVRLGSRGLALAVGSRRPATLFEWSERARMLASRVQPVRAPQSPEIVAGLAELRGEVSGSREAELRARIRELAWRHDGSHEVMDPVSLVDLQAALGPATALVAYVVAADRVVALVVTDRAAAWHDLDGRAALDPLLRGLLPDLDMAASDLPEPIGPVVRGGLVGRLERLAAILVAPLAGDLGDRGVVLTPSGALAGVPWTLLPGLCGRPVTVAQSATSWLARGTTSLRTGSAGLVAGPRVARADDEVRAAAKEWPDPTVLTGPSATAEAVSALAATVDVLHVAAHGQHSAENPLFSGLQLHDGLWFGYDIDQLAAVPDVVLLSACEVGRSAVRWGEELIGMATAWLHAGARCVIASPAAVADEAAYEAFVTLHRGLADGLAPAAALAAAVPEPTADRPPVPLLCFA